MICNLFISLRILTCCFIVVVFSVFLANFFSLQGTILLREPVILAIGILSARENFKLREIGRSTWLTEFMKTDITLVKAWFILGNSSCNIPPEYRLSPYNCEKWNVNVSGTEGKIYTLTERSSTSPPGESIVNYQGFSFKVNHPIVVSKLGVLSQILLSNTDAKVAIVDVQTKEIIVQTTIFGNTSTSYHGYTYSTIEKILLPKGYEGLILFEGYMQHLIFSNIEWNDGGGVITFERVFPTPDNLDSVIYTKNVGSTVSMQFYVDELDSLKTITREESKVTKKWQDSLNELQEKIDLEKEKYGDTIIINSMDVYRNLPVKLLKFYKWLHLNHQFSYVMKIDDDSVINVKHVLKKLEEQRFDPKSMWLWSRFRKNWPVNYMGKWTDHEYKSSYYPSFPCGAAYVMSYQTAFWLSENSELLYPYQGEDVSQGIWLSAINPDFIEDDNFECDSRCNVNSYNRGQLQVDQIKEAWQFLKECNNLCQC